MYTLEECKYCQELKNELDKYSIGYRDINISQNPLLGDKLEELFHCKKYPMVVVESNSTITWLPEYFSLPSPHIKIYTSITHLIKEILK